MGGLKLSKLQFHSIQWKISLPFIALLIFAVICSSMLSQMMLSNASDYTLSLIEKQLDEQKRVVESVTQNKVNDTINASILLAEQLALQPEVIQGIKENNREKIHQALKRSVQVAKEKANIDLIWITRLADRKNDGSTPILACPTNPSFDGFDKLNYHSTNQAMDSAQTVASWEVNEEDGKLQVTAPIIDQGKVIGAIVVGQQTYQGFVKGIAEASNTGATLFLTPNQQDFYVMTDSQTDELGKTIFESSHEKLKEKALNVDKLAADQEIYENIMPYLKKAVTSPQPFTETLTINQQQYVMQFKPLETYDKKIVGIYTTRFPGFTASKQEIIDQSQSTMYIFYSVAVALIILSMIISFIIAKRISSPILQVVQRLEWIADGDLRGEKLPVWSKDEVGRLVQAINLMGEKLHDLIGKTSVLTSQVAASSEQLSASAEQTTHATNHIAMAVQEVASGSERQLSGSEESSKTMADMASGIHRIAQTSMIVSDSSNQAANQAEEGAEFVDKVISQMKIIDESVGHSAKIIEALDERSKEIGQIVEVISDISNQTNLLALNAAIEAARAGEHGRGFAVVANEVRKLAEQSKQSAVQITQLILEIQDDTKRAVMSMSTGTKEVRGGLNIATQAGEAFQNIRVSFERVAQQIREVSAASQQMSENAQVVSSSVEELALIAKQASASSQNVASASQEQLASMEEITASAAALSEMASELQEILNKFKI